MDWRKRETRNSGVGRCRHWICAQVPWSAVQALVLLGLVLALIIASIILDTLKKKDSEINYEYHIKLVERVNAANSTWKARLNPFALKADPSFLNYPLDIFLEKRKQLDADGRLLSASREHIRRLHESKISIPSHFDARTKWPLCGSLHEVRNQGGCGSCYAVSAASVMSDRICIHSNGTKTPRISAEDIIACCELCDGCSGTVHAIAALIDWRDRGVVTGGPFGSHEGCRPYTVSSSCGVPCSTDFYTRSRTPSCIKECQQFYYAPYEEDKHYASEIYQIITDEPFMEKLRDSLSETADPGSSLRLYDRSIQDWAYGGIADGLAELVKKDLMLYGPVQACFFVHEDFQHYISGIYTRIEGELMYGHCAKVIGWGTTATGTTYWTMVNSWGRNWGENGFFRYSEFNAVTEVVAGLPK